MGWQAAGCCGGKDGRKVDPTLKEQIAFAAKATGRILKHGIVLADKATRRKRVAICHECEHEGGHKCKICGCLLILKRPLATEACPDDPPRWEATVEIAERKATWQKQKKRN